MLKYIRLEEFREYLEHKGLKCSTIDSYLSDTKAFIKYLDRYRIKEDLLESSTLDHFMNELLQNKTDKQNSIRRKVIGIKKYFQFLHESQVLPSNPFEQNKIPARLEAIPNLDTLYALRSHLEKNKTPKSLKEARDDAILRLLGLEGLKVSEIIELDWPDHLNSGFRPTLRVPGTRARTISLGQNSNTSLKNYKILWNNALPKKKHHKMFVGFKGREASIILEQVTRHGLKHMIYQVGKIFGVPKLNTEILRHIAIDHQISQGLSGEEIMHHFGLQRMGNIAMHLRQV